LVRLRQSSAETGVGLAGMRERMHELTGKLEIDSDGRGTMVRATVPLYAVTQSIQMAGLERGESMGSGQDCQ